MPRKWIKIHLVCISYTWLGLLHIVYWIKIHTIGYIVLKTELNSSSIYMKQWKASSNCGEIQITMNFMDIEWVPNCGYDFFQIAWPSDFGEIATSQKFCGHAGDFPEEGLTIESSGFALRWKTDGSVLGDGFELEWSCTHGQRIPQIDPCNLSFAFKFSVYFCFFLIDDTGYFRS